MKRRRVEFKNAVPAPRYREITCVEFRTPIEPRSTGSGSPDPPRGRFLPAGIGGSGAGVGREERPPRAKNRRRVALSETSDGRVAALGIPLPPRFPDVPSSVVARLPVLGGSVAGT